MTDCIFCKIVKGELPSAKIYEDDDVFAFMNLMPVTRGHSLVVPKKHSDDILQADSQDLNKTINMARRIADAAMKALGTDSFTITNNRGEHSGRTVHHLHFHVIPRYSTDGLKPWPQQPELELKTRKEIAEAIKKNL